MDLLDFFEKRHSVRAYTDEKLTDEQIEKILKAGVLAPTAANKQPFKLIVVKSETGLKNLATAANFYDAPCAFLVLAKKDAAWHRPYDEMVADQIDASIVTDHMMLEATALGLGSLWICMFKADVLNQHFNVEDGYEVINILAVGHEDQNAKKLPKKRKSVSELVEFA